MSDARREEAMAAIQEAFIAIARRGSARARRAGGLSSVDHSVLTHVAAHAGIRAIDIAAHFGLNRSTLSRQIAHLAGQGLLAYAEAEGRGQALTVTDKGEKALEAARGEVRTSVTERLEAWSTDEVTELARMLSRYMQD